MTPDPGPCIEALKCSSGRLQQAVAEGCAAAFAPLGEFLWWAVIIDGLLDSAIDDWRSVRNEGCPALLGLRHARNVVGHGINPTRLTEVTEGMTFPKTFPMSFTEVRFLPFDAVPPLERPPTAAVHAAYRQHVQERVVRHLARAVVEFVSDHAAPLADW